MDMQWIRDRGLTLLLMAMFLLFLVGQVLSGRAEYNAEQQLHGQPTVSMSGYFATGHPWEALFENWESEFLQMGFYVLLTIGLFQKGSSESKRPGVLEMVDLDPRESPKKGDAPWPVRQGGVMLWLYERSLSLAFAALFALSFWLHATTGLIHFNEERIDHGEPAAVLGDYLTSSQFWFESFQNWQSEFLSLAAMVVLSIFLRQRGSPESKPVDAPTWETHG
jgi:hypothetical protein